MGHLYLSVVRLSCGFKSEHQKDRCLVKIGLRSQKLLNFQGSIVSIMSGSNWLFCDLSLLPLKYYSSNMRYQEKNPIFCC